MLIQINGKQYADASNDIVVLRLTNEEKNGIAQAKQSDDLFAYFPKNTKEDAVKYHVNKMDDYIAKINKSPVDDKLKKLSDDNQELRKQIENLRNGIVNPVSMDKNDVGLQLVNKSDVKPETVEAEIIQPEEVN